MPITLRLANIKDLDTLLYWGKQKHVIDTIPATDDWNWKFELSRTLEWRKLLIAELDESPIGFIQIIDPYLEETHYWGKGIEKNKRAIDIWIGEETNLNKGYGTTMIQLAIERCFSNKDINGVLIDPLKSNTKAHRFYKRLGFEFIEERLFGTTPCSVFELKRDSYLATL